MSAQQPRAEFFVVIDDTELDEDLRGRIGKVIVEDESTLPDLAIVMFDDPRLDVIAAIRAKVGSSLEIRVQTGDAPRGETIFDGEITALEVEVEHEFKRTVLRGYDKGHRLQRGRTTKTFQDMSIGDLVSSVAGEHGLSAGETGDMRWVNPVVTQWNQSDWDFLTQLAADFGHEVVCEGTKLSLRPSPAASGGPGPGQQEAASTAQLVAGRNLLRVRAVQTAGDQAATVEVRGWDPKQKKEVVGTASSKKSDTHNSGVDPKKLANGTGTGAATLVRTDLPFDNTEPATAAAKGIVAQLGGVAAEIEGVTYGNPALRAGEVINISGIGSPFDGDHTLTSCRHVMSATQGYSTEFRSCGTQRRGMLGLVTGGLAGRAREVTGVVPALVSDIDDPDKGNRVRVSFPWLGDNAVSAWARVMMPGAGPDRGVMFFPEVGDEVLVGFHHGDTRLPYVLGGLHNGKDKMPAGAKEAGAVDKRVIVSRDNHRLEFDDKDKKILLSVGDDKLQIEMAGNDTKITVRSDGEVEITSKGNLDVKSDGDLSLEARGKVQIKGMGVAIDAGGAAFEAKGVQAKISGSAQLELTGAQAKLAGSAMTEISGGLVKIN